MKPSKEQLEIYRTCAVDMTAPFRGACLICGRLQAERPSWWHAPFGLERIHIVNKPRRELRELVVIGCSLCHRRMHGDNFPPLADENRVPNLEELLAIKKHCDPFYWNRELLQKHSVRRLPEETSLDQACEVSWACRLVRANQNQGKAT